MVDKMLIFVLVCAVANNSTLDLLLVYYGRCVMLYPICNGRVLTDEVVNLVQNERFVIILISTVGFSGGSRFYLSEKIDDAIGSKPSEDEHDLLESIEVVIPESDLPFTKSLRLEWEYGFQNLGTRCIKIHEVTLASHEIDHDPVYFDVTVGSNDHTAERVSTRNNRIRRMLEGVLIASLLAIAGLAIYMLAKEIFWEHSQDTAVAAVQDCDCPAQETSNAQAVQVSECPAIACPEQQEPVVPPTCEVCKTCPEPAATNPVPQVIEPVKKNPAPRAGGSGITIYN